ncbi:MAG: hypothetical protein P4L86_27670 [Mycobacterium sp.]|nr:hypothetical protein [Mycobacterium sp.]
MVTKSEQQAFVEIESRLAAKFSTISSTQVAATIGNAREQFADSKIRDFVPLLVERRAEHELGRLLAGTAVHS